jgi:hypothetical protein
MTGEEVTIRKRREGEKKISRVWLSQAVFGWKPRTSNPVAQSCLSAWANYPRPSAILPSSLHENHSKYEEYKSCLYDSVVSPDDISPFYNVSMQLEKNASKA